MSAPCVIISCEHASNAVPADYAAMFRDAADTLAGHRGWDIGAAELARRFAETLGTTAFLADTTRLLVDLNRSPGHPQRFSEYTRGQAATVRRRIVDQHYSPYRAAVERAGDAALSTGEVVLHLSVHSFAPELDGISRRADIGLLYDPNRALETALARRWHARLAALGRHVRRNYPYRGGADGLVTTLRRRLDPVRYIGLELEVNQRWPLGDAVAWARIQRDLIATLQAVLTD